MTHTPTEIAAMIERLKLFARIEDGGGSCDLQFQTSPSREAAAMLRDVAAERDAMAERIDGLTEDALRFKRMWNDARDALRKSSDNVYGLEYRLGEAEAERDRLSAERDRYRDLAAKTHKANMATNDESDKLKAEHDRLAAMVEKLRGYVAHDDDAGCGGDSWEHECTCGLSDLLQQSQPLDQQPPSAPTDVKP